MLHCKSFNPATSNPWQRLSAHHAATSGDTTMATQKQVIGNFGERLVAKELSCPRCKSAKTLKCLPPNFKCADLICDFCGYLAQVKTLTVTALDSLPDTILGADWEPQKARMDAGIYFPLFLVLKSEQGTAIFYLPADLQQPALFVPRNPLSSTARKAGWRGFRYVIKGRKNAFMRLK